MRTGGFEDAPAAPATPATLSIQGRAIAAPRPRSMVRRFKRFVISLSLDRQDTSARGEGWLAATRITDVWQLHDTGRHGFRRSRREWCVCDTDRRRAAR